MPRFYEMAVVKSHFDDLNIIRYIDSGGFKDVFLVESESDQRFVLKLLPVDRRNRQKRAVRECKAMEEIESSSFVELLDYYQDVVADRETFVIYEEYVPGRTLETVISEGEANVQLGLSIMSELLDLIDEFRDIGIVHRDIKPANIILGPSGSFTLLDVGIVRFEEMTSLTPDHADRGPATKRYGAPEQLENRKEDQDCRTDLFTSGIVFYESITGDHPYLGQDENVIDAICEGARKPLAQEINDSNKAEELDTFYQILTEPQPYLRFRTPKIAKKEFTQIAM